MHRVSTRILNNVIDWCDINLRIHLSSLGDICAAPCSLTVWTEQRPGQCKNWKYVVPNVMVTGPDGKVYYGLIMELGHGVCISWDDKFIHHETVIPETGPGNYVFSIMWAVNGRHMEQFKKDSHGD